MRIDARLSGNFVKLLKSTAPSSVTLILHFSSIRYHTRIRMLVRAVIHFALLFIFSLSFSFSFVLFFLHFPGTISAGGRHQLPLSDYRRTEFA